MAKLARNLHRGLIRLSEQELLEALQLPREYKVVALKMMPIEPRDIRITVEHASLPVYEVGKPLVEVERGNV